MGSLTKIFCYDPVSTDPESDLSLNNGEIENLILSNADSYSRKLRDKRKKI